MNLTARRIDRILDLLRVEMMIAWRKHGPMHSAHEGYAVILEELDEAWDAIKANDHEHAREEMVQVGAMVVKFLMRATDDQLAALEQHYRIVYTAHTSSKEQGDGK